MTAQQHSVQNVLNSGHNASSDALVDSLTDLCTKFCCSNERIVNEWAEFCRRKDAPLPEIPSTEMLVPFENWLKYRLQASHVTQLRLKQPTTPPGTKRRLSNDAGPTRFTLGCSLSLSSDMLDYVSGSPSPPKCRRKSLSATRSNLVQTVLDAGQRTLAGTPQMCRQCGMIFAAHDSNDEQAHAAFHSRQAVLSWKGFKHENVVRYAANGDRVMRLLEGDLKSNKRMRLKIDQLIDHVDMELGFAQGRRSVSPCLSTAEKRPNDRLGSGQQIYLYVCCRLQKIVGMLLAEPVQKAYRVQRRPDDVAALKSRENIKSTNDEPNIDKASIFEATRTVQPAVAGVSRLWVLPDFRRRGVATLLMDAFRENYSFGCILSKDIVCMSDPSVDGTAFADAYFNSSFLVYNDGA